MPEETDILKSELVQQNEIIKKIWKFIIETALDNSNCDHVNKAKELLKELTKNL